MCNRENAMQTKRGYVIHPVLVDLFQDQESKWQFRFRAPNGNVICQSKFGYVSRIGAKRAVVNFTARIARGDIIESNRPKSMDRK